MLFCNLFTSSSKENDRLTLISRNGNLSQYKLMLYENYLVPCFRNKNVLYCFIFVCSPWANRPFVNSRGHRLQFLNKIAVFLIKQTV